MPIYVTKEDKEADNVAFDAMKKAAKNKASDLFTESEYNTIATDKDRAGYDVKAHDILLGMWNKDRADKKFKNIDFSRYVELLKPSLFEERVYSREGDQKSGDFFLDIYEGDFDQFKASALKGGGGDILGRDVSGPRRKRFGTSGKY
jgi:hypothetical protein|tara:strand:+ start:619 stop:1059 length:441 start_codon:yes stop_codon:yes gene_type:complete